MTRPKPGTCACGFWMTDGCGHPGTGDHCSKCKCTCREVNMKCPCCGHQDE
jgi:hypothetical protein